MLGRIRNVLRDPTIVPRYLRAKRKLLRLRYRQRNNRGIFSVNIHSANGFFAQLTWCLYIFAYCDDRNLIPHVVLTSANYVDPDLGPDWFQYFFEQREQAYVQQNLVTTSRIHTLRDLGLPTRCFAQMSIERAALLAQKYLKVRPVISQAVDAFVDAHLTGSVVLGVHYRGTDKEDEAPRVPYDEVRRVIQGHLQQHPDVGRIFVATDETAFLAYMKDCAGVPICYCDDLRSSTGAPVFRPKFPGNGYQKGREALVNALLLSRCQRLIRTSSFLSAWASIFNPGLPVTMLNEPYRDFLWFPDKAIVQRAHRDAAPSLSSKFP
jgi:hypothetical protein